MRIILTLLLAFYFVGCGKKSNKESETMNGVGFGDEAQENKPFFTITHRATDSEDVFIYLQEPGTVVYKPRTYTVTSRTCFKLTDDQFANLVVKMTPGGGGGRLKTACDTKDNICQPNNYEVINEGRLLILNKYVLNPVDQPNTSEQCIPIEEWMESKSSET